MFEQFYVFKNYQNVNKGNERHEFYYKPITNAILLTLRVEYAKCGKNRVHCGRFWFDANFNNILHLSS